jgi:hypothetical protein
MQGLDSLKMTNFKTCLKSLSKVYMILLYFLFRFTNVAKFGTAW